ncbi:right-handed parallel beta-helix repeat-containing protein [Luteimonas suaedae]|uniref:right-handed parallel beta-helix repeat-containing protein n=1 Tax=Luteimonas suaedae TaxID=2605430 RepID=UPI0011EBB504|nr:right-handed parallel beta-helix repeat-containing protein [Luteimonas suaedae]
MKVIYGSIFLILASLWPSSAHADKLLYVDASPTPCASYPSLQRNCYSDLQSAYNSIPSTITENHRILVLPGLHTRTRYCYNDRYTSLCIEAPSETSGANWDKTAPNYSLSIEAFDPDNPPVFDGGGARDFVWLRSGPGRATNLVLSNLHITNYQNGALNLSPLGTGGYNAGNEVKNCTISKMGGANYGYGAILIGNSRDNHIHDNVFMDISNAVPDNQYHAIYDTGGTRNIIENNTIINSIGDPVKFAGGANNSVVRNNYIVSSAMQCYVQSYKYDGNQHASNIRVHGNTFVYPHGSVAATSNAAEDLPIDTTCCHYPQGWDSCPSGTFINADGSQLVGDGNNYVYGDYPEALETTALASADFDRDGRSEVMRGQLLPTSLAIVDSSADNGLRVFTNHLYSSSGWKPISFTTGDFRGSGQTQLVSAFRANGDRIYSGDGTSSITNSRLYTGDFVEWKVVAMTAGDFLQDGSDDLVVAFESTGGETKICRGSGTISNEFNPETAGCGRASLLYASSAWKVRALTSGPFYEDASEYIAVAFKNGTTSRVYLMDGSTGSFVNKVFDDTSNLSITAMTSGYFDETNYHLITAWRTSSNTTEVYRGTGTSYGTINGDGGVKNLGMMYSSSSWHVSHLWGDELRPGSGAEVITVFREPASGAAKEQAWLGNGSTGLMSYYKLYESN